MQQWISRALLGGWLVMAGCAGDEPDIGDVEVNAAEQAATSLDSPNGFTAQSWTGAWGSDGPNFVGDLNGDGRTDVFMWRDADKSWMVNLSTGSGFSMQRWTGAWGSDGPIFVGDLNGDGRRDVFMWRDADKSWMVNLSTGSGFVVQQWFGAWGSDGPIRLGDLNGDGRTDVFMWRDWAKDWTVNLSTGSGFSMQAWGGAWGSDGPINVGDLNGDGRTDVFMWRDWAKDWTVNLSTGAGFAMQAWAGAWGSDGPINVGDLNGDGRTDVFMYRATGNDWMVNLSTGNGFAMQRWLGACGTDGPTELGDFNGDGRTDVLVWRDANKDWLLNLSTGGGFHMQRWEGMWGSDGTRLIADLDGDGRKDVVMWRHPALRWSVNLSLPVALGPARVHDFGISAVEVSQAVQDLRNGVPLFAGKKTLARVYADAGVCSSGPPRDNVAVSATVVRAAAPTQPVWGPITVGPQQIPRRVTRDNWGDTINFELPKHGPGGAGWSTTEAYTLRITTNPCIDLAANPATCARRLAGGGQTVEVPLRFYASVPLHVRPIYDDINGNIVTTAQFARVAERVGQMYPVADLIVHDFGDVERGLWSSWAKLGDHKTKAMKQDAKELAAGRPPKYCGDCFFVGVPWVAPGSWPNGLASTPLPTTTEFRLVLADLDPTDINWSAATLAQEIGHILGRYHATSDHWNEPDPDPSYPYAHGAQSDDVTYTLLPNVVSRGRTYGLDPGPSAAPAWRIIPSRTPTGEHRHDFMSYGAGADIWTSDYTFKGLCSANRSGHFDTRWMRVSQLSAASLPPTSLCPAITPFVLP